MMRFLSGGAGPFDRFPSTLTGADCRNGHRGEETSSGAELALAPRRYDGDRPAADIFHGRHLIARAREGDRGALGGLFEPVYPDLRRWADVVRLGPPGAESQGRTLRRQDPEGCRTVRLAGRAAHEVSGWAWTWRPRRRWVSRFHNRCCCVPTKSSN